MRVIWFLPPSIVVVVALFLFMAQLASSGRGYQADVREDLDLNILRMRLDSDVQLRERQLPPPPAMQAQPQQADPLEVDVNALEMSAVDIPNIPFDTNFKISAPLAKAPVINALAEMPSELMLDMARMPQQRINPQYPPRALRRKIEGYVLVEFIVDAQGRVEPASINFIEAEPPGVFERVARRAVSQWRFDPMISQGKAIRFKSRQRFEFKLDR